MHLEDKYLGKFGKMLNLEVQAFLWLFQTE